jgi:hypothetical protein
MFKMTLKMIAAKILCSLDKIIGSRGSAVSRALALSSVDWGGGIEFRG